MRVAGNVLVSLPTRAEEFLHAFATRFWNMDKDATILVVDRRLILLGVNGLAVLNNQGVSKQSNSILAKDPLDLSAMHEELVHQLTARACNYTLVYIE